MTLTTAAIAAVLVAPASPPAESRAWLAVAFLPQVPPGTWRDTTNCGPACLAMAASYARRSRPSSAQILKIDRHLGLDENGRPCTHCDQLVRAGKAVFGLTLAQARWDLAAVKREVVSGGPVIVELRAGCLANRGYGYSGSHFVTVIGLRPGRIICHDPLNPKGRARSYPARDFERAMAGDTGLVVHGFRRPPPRNH